MTGAGGGIGAAISAALARNGATVGLLGRHRSKLLRVASRIEGGGHSVQVVDLTSDTEVRNAVGSFMRQFGRLDVLVHSNGIYSTGTLERTRVRDFDKLWASNVRGPFVLTQLLVAALRASKGQIAFVNSSVVLASRSGVGPFATTQHALRALADTLRVELNPAGIRVLSVYPGRTATERQRRIFKAEGREYVPGRLLQPEDVAAVVTHSLLLPRTAEVTDVQIRSMIPT